MKYLSSLSQYGDEPSKKPMVYDDLSRIQEALHRTKKPSGKIYNPGVTCKDLLIQNPDFEDGKAAFIKFGKESAMNHELLKYFIYFVVVILLE